MTRAAIIAVHDVAPATWRDCARLMELLYAHRALPATLLVVPDYHRSGTIVSAPWFVRELEALARNGCELALHGYFHLDDGPAPRTPGEFVRRRLLTAMEGEFATLDQAEAERRITHGLALFARAGWRSDGFVPPAWLASAGTRKALASTGIGYTSNHRSLVRMHDGRTLCAPVITASARSASRAIASRAWLRVATRLLDTCPLLRVALHPADARSRGVLAAWRDVVAETAATRRILTKREAIAAA